MIDLTEEMILDLVLKEGQMLPGDEGDERHSREREHMQCTELPTGMVRSLGRKVDLEK